MYPSEYFFLNVMFVIFINAMMYNRGSGLITPLL